MSFTLNLRPQNIAIICESFLGLGIFCFYFYCCAKVLWPKVVNGVKKIPYCATGVVLVGSVVLFVCLLCISFAELVALHQGHWFFWEIFQNS